MKRITINSTNDLYSLKEVNQSYDEIEINLRNLKFKGLVRHAIKYANHALKVGGLMSLKTTPFISYHFRANAIDFWQVKYEVFNSLKNAVELISVNQNEGTLVLKKKEHLYNYSGISFGIVFSGNENEEQQLIDAIESIERSKVSSDVNCEVLISGPQNYNPAKVLERFHRVSIKYLPIDVPTNPRLMICIKKNFLYANAQYSLVVISHTRISFADNFISTIAKSMVEMCTPAVYYKHEENQYKYLDIGFIDGYQDIQFGASRRIIAGENVDVDYLHWYKKRVPYIDGGLNVFNKNIIKAPPYNDNIAWGEAEDVDICNRLFQDGILIDYLPEITCFSVTNKLTGYSKIKGVGRKVFRWLNKNTS